MRNIRFINHRKGSPLLRIFGFGPNLFPVNALSQIKLLMQKNSFWAKNRNIKDIKYMLKNSSKVITLWNEKRLIGFGRATSDGIYRAVLWDIIIDEKYHNKGLGKLLLNKLLEDKAIKSVEKIYLMTTNCKEFYEYCGFTKVSKQHILIKKNSL